MKKRKIDPELEARWAEERRQLQSRIEYHQAKLAEERQRAERRRRLLRRVSLGLLSR